MKARFQLTKNDELFTFNLLYFLKLFGEWGLRAIFAGKVVLFAEHVIVIGIKTQANARFDNAISYNVRRWDFQSFGKL